MRVMRPISSVSLVERVLFTAVAAGAVAGGAVAGRRRSARRAAVRAAIARRHDRPPAPGEYRLTVVVPAFREERIGTTVSRLRKELVDIDEDGGLEIVVVDDGSEDGTAEQAEAAGADVVIRQPENRGKGAAVRAGMLAARGRTTAFTDADLSYAPDQLVALLDQVEQGWDIVVGSRRHDDTTTLVRAGLLRQAGGRAINRCTRLVLVAEHEDTQCGIKAFRSDVARLVFGHSRVDGFAFDVEVLHLAERYRLSVVEVPVVVENSDRSTVRVVRDAVRLLRDLARIRQWSRAGSYALGEGEALPAGGPGGGERATR
jgi:dolichyl-phosphate beta-glucosyltransferase